MFAPTTQSLDRKQFPETARFVDANAALKADGLLDVKFFAATSVNATVEGFCAEVNRARAAEVLNDPEFF